MSPTAGLPKILFINNTSKMSAGTSQSLCLLIKCLSASYNISVVSDSESQELPQALAKLNVPHYAFHNRTILFLPELIFHILANNIDLVYGNNLSGRTRVAFWAARIMRRPYIWHIRESIKKDDKRGKEVHLADAVIANSEDTSRRLIQFADVKSPIVIPNGVELDAYEIDRVTCHRQLVEKLGVAQDTIFVINLGRICEQKNQPEAVQIGINVLDSFPQTHFLFLGDFQDSVYFNQLIQKINATKYKNNFHFLGYINDFIPYLLGSNILLHTARREPQGRVIIEAMAARLPVVAFSVGGVGESIIPGETGFLRPFGDIEGLTSDLEQLLSDRSLRVKYGKAGYLRVQKYFTAENTAKQVNNVIDGVLIGSTKGKT